jgi:hypothetical protein
MTIDVQGNKFNTVASISPFIPLINIFCPSFLIIAWLRNKISSNKEPPPYKNDFFLGFHNRVGFVRPGVWHE